MTWKVFNSSGNQLFGREFDSREEAQAHTERMGSFLAETTTIIFDHENTKIKRMINEGLVKNDLRDILLPRLSVDEYVPGDPNTDNVVLALFIKGVPEAVLPFKNFCEKSDGVIDVDYGDSDTIPDASIIYCEFDRENLKLKNIQDLIEQIGMLSALKPEDFTMTFPHTTTKFPYEMNVINAYFQSRTKRKNKIAQKQAIQKANVDMNKDNDISKEVKEGLIVRMGNILFEENE